MSTISDNLRATILSLKLISARLKNIGSTGAKESAATANKEAIITAINNAEPDLSSLATEANATSNKADIIEHIDLALQANMTAMGISGLTGVTMNVITDDGQTTAYTLNANEIYYFAQRISDLTITLDLTSVDVGDVPNFHMIIDCRNATPLTVVIKDSQNNNVAWGNIDNPEFKNRFMYEIGILNNLALYVKYEV